MNPYGELHRQTQQEVLKLAEHYGMDPETIRPIVWERIDSILQAKDTSDALGIAKNLKNGFLTTCLAQWAKGNIRGPATPENLEKKAKKAENLSEMLEKKGNEKGAEQQKKRAEKLRKAASQKKPAGA